LFGISRQSYYRAGWRTRHRREVASQVVTMVKEIRRDLPRVGTRKLYYMLRDSLSELGVGRDKLFAIINANNLSIKPLRSYRMTTDSKHLFHKHKNLIMDTVPTRPEQIWVGDITYIGNRNNYSYLSLITDAYSKKIVGYNLSENLNAEGCVRALKMAVKNREYAHEPLIHHTDRGIQYCCDDYQKQIAKYKIKCSMTEGYDPYANAVAERVNGILKQEFLLEEYDVYSLIMKKIIKQSIENYNEIRPHLSCKMLTPNQMHQQNTIKIKTYKKGCKPKSLHPLTDNLILSNL
jgi:putative transposase